MNKLLKLLIFISVYGIISRVYAESDSMPSLKGLERKMGMEKMYIRGTDMGWHYGRKLLSLAEGHERRLIELDLASFGFNYWLLVRRKEVERSKSFEGQMKEVLKIVSQDIIKDPLNRNEIVKGGGRRGVSGIKSIIVTNEEYEATAKEFAEFLNKS